MSVLTVIEAYRVEAELVRLRFERDLYKQALVQIAKWPATGKAQELARTALEFAEEVEGQ